MPRGGKPVRMTNDAYEDRHPAWSPDGRQLLYASDRTGTYQLWLRDMATGTERRLQHRGGQSPRVMVT